MITFMTNRPLVSRVHKEGHLALMYYKENSTLEGDRVLPVVKVDNVPVTMNQMGNPDGLVQLHVPRSVFASGRVMTVALADNVTLETLSDTYTFNIVQTPKLYFITLAWLNPLGGIDHYTFYADAGLNITSEKKKIYGNDGVRIVKSIQVCEFSMYSDFERYNVRRWIAEIISSPKVWALEDGKITPIEITDSEFKTISTNLEQLFIKFKPMKHKILQSL